MQDVNMISENTSVSTPRRSIQITEDEPVGFEDDAKCIIELLTRGTEELDIIPILGMPGLGKTTLAKKIFNDPLIVSQYFDVRAWATISQSYDVREVLKDIYRQVTGDKSNVHDIADMLRKCLMCKRYLIVLDDIWNVEALSENLRLSFPDRGNGSRILLTTRLERVAREVKCFTNPYSLRFLTMEESWELLQKKAFQKETCPHELRDVGLKLTQLCKGLPLTIVVIGGILSKRQQNVSEWSEVAHNLKSHMGAVENEGYLAIQLSYQYLPVHLRHCLLAIGVFREDEKIVVSRLMLLWIAEGFVQYSDETKLEEVAEGYLMDLISSSLIMVSKMTFDGKAKYLQIHDLARDFCLKRAKEEKFMQVIIGSHNQYQSSCDEEQRVCIHLKDKLYKHFQTDFGVALDDILTCTSLEQKFTSLFVTTESIVPTISLSSSIGDFRLLRVFDLPACRLRDYENVLQSLVHLRYLRMWCDEFYFKWVSHLCYLETLIVKSKELVTDGTPHIWRMTKLRHVNVDTILHLKVAGTSEEHTSKLLNLRTFQSMSLSEHDIEYLAARFPNLRHLLLKVIDSDESERNLKLEVLAQLQTLSLNFGGRFTKISFPSSLKELIIHKTYISKHVASTIGELSNLEKLAFVECQFENDEWNVRDVEFPALKYLKFRKVGLRQWHVPDSSFAVLEKLELIHCRDIEKIPHSFVDVITLKSIKVISCLPFLLGDSALDVKKEVEEITGCDSLQVYVFRNFYRGTADELTADEISTCQEVFQNLMNHDFRITSKEVKTLMMRAFQQNPTEAELKDIVNEFDGDGDGALDFSDFLNLMSWTKINESVSDQQALKNIFSTIDKNGDGFVPAVALRRILTTIGDTKLTEEEINERIREADVRGDGKINFKEFSKAMKPKYWK